MAQERIVVWVQRFLDRSSLMLQWHDPATGRRRSKSAGTTDVKLAETRRADLEADLNAGRHREPARLSWEEFRRLLREEYLPLRRPNTRANYEQALDHLERYRTPRRLADADTGLLAGWVAAGLRSGLKPSTVRVRLVFLRGALAWAVARGWLPALPAAPEVKVPRKRPQPVPAGDAAALLRACTPELRAFLLCGWLAGLRLREAWALRWDHCDDAPYLDAVGKRIVLPAELVKGVEDQWVPLSPALLDALRALPRTGPRVFACLAGRSGRPVRADAVIKRVARAARAAGVPLTMRSLRRGFACRHAATVPAQVLQRLLRHASIATTMGYYANADAAATRAVLEESGPGVTPDVTSTPEKATKRGRKQSQG